MPLQPESTLLTDRVAVVTGAAMGIGRAIAVAFAGFGAHVAVCDRDAERLEDVAREVASLDRKVVRRVLDVRVTELVQPLAADMSSDTHNVAVVGHKASR